MAIAAGDLREHRGQLLAHGHLPHLEQPAATFRAIDAFVATIAA